MRQAFGWVMAVILCCSAEGRANEGQPAARLREAQADFDEATKLHDAGKYAEALARSEHALALREAVLGKRHTDVAQSLNNLASLSYEQGLYEQAEPLCQRALAIWEAALGKSHPDVALALTNLARIYYRQGLYGRAEPLFQRALAIREATLGESHPVVAQSLSNLATLYKTQGLYGHAEPLYQRALAIQEVALGKTHSDIASSLNNLANLYAGQGLYGRAEPLYQRALAMWETVLGKSHPAVALALNNLATVYSDQGLYGRAESLHQRALAIRAVTLGKSHPSVADSLNDLANVYWKQGMYGRAESFYRRALAIQEAALGKSHPDVANSLHNLANLYRARGFYGRAEPLYQRAWVIREVALGNNHPKVVESLNDLGQLWLAQHRLSEALPLFTQAFSISEQRLRHEALDFSETRLASFLAHLRADEQRLYALLRAHPENARVRHLALSAVLLHKGRSVAETASISRTLYRSLGPEDRDTFEQLRSLRTQRAALSFSGPGGLTPESYQQRLHSLAEEGDALEANLAKRSAPLRSLTALPSPAGIVDRVASALPKDGALVEFIAYQDHPLVYKPGTLQAKVASPMRYLALVLFPDASTRAVDLGPAPPIDRAASRLHDALAESEASFQSASQALYRRAFQPLLPLLGTTRRLYLSPDGQLGLVPFYAFHDGQGFLLDSFDFTHFTSGRELLRESQDSAPPSSVFVLADPSFTSFPASVSAGALPAPGAPPLSGSLERFFSTLPQDLLRDAWVPLPGSRLEAQGIQRLLPQAQLFLGPEATKQRLLQLPTPGILHLATHGFFLDKAPSAPGSRGLAAIDALDGAPSPQQEPLLNSGLVLAGAHPPASEFAASSPEATLVTALELAGLNLWGTQLVVLSACDTGRGQVLMGQGVYGLRHAFVAAGAETVLVSLWKVNDDSTRLLMDLYYRNLLAGQGRASALRAAMISLRASHPHPHAWAPFIALGSDEPLRAILPSVPQTPEPKPRVPHKSQD
ncbi:CHAT domain-containing tetratricopeptide repeat protein [Stigmatella erecta]|uniref:Tetratricopeptide repeat-containing protein n=1 Tax=Stigmatella erecta TaxID=83460 RepID=A0A1I0KIS8_9BACT|nr:tetratricopeptide repeat protein [Stigmatella erecta]SEU24508.1 Tetratricopeptide repeat-containing protein [Stigmatella erecta]